MIDPVLVISTITLILVVIIFVALIVIGVYVYKLVSGSYKELIDKALDKLISTVKESMGNIIDDKMSGIKESVNDSRLAVNEKMSDIEKVFDEIKELFNAIPGVGAKKGFLYGHNNSAGSAYKIIT